MTIFIKTLGQIDLRDSAGSELRALLTQPKRLAVLIYLAANATDKLGRRDTLLAMFWPESDSERARAALRQALHFIRQAAGDEVVINRGADEIGLQSEFVQLDVSTFDQLADAGRNEEALAAYTGNFLDGFFVRGAPEFERWAAAERDRLRRRAADCAWSVVEAKVASDELSQAREVAERAVRLSADSEIAVRRFIELLARSGDKTAALSVYREFATHLADEFGVQPSPETLALVDSLASSGVAPTMPDGVVQQSETRAAATDVATARDVSPPRTRRLALIAAVVALVAIGAAILYGRMAGSSVQLDPNRVAVLPFLVKGNADLRYLHDGLPLLLATRLDGVPSLHTVDMRAVLIEQSRRGGDSLSLESASETANKFGAQLYIVGSVVGSAGQLSIDATLFDGARPGKPIAHAQATGAEPNLVELVDRIAAGLLAERYRETGGLVAEMAARTTNSFVALKSWLEGESDMARGRYTPAMAAFRTSIAADSTFAMAYYRLAVAAAWSGDLAVVGPSATKAVELSSALPPPARTIIQAFLASRTGRYGDAERMERALLAERPTSIDAWFDLGEVLFHSNPARGRPISEAHEPFEQLYRMDPSSFAAMSHLVRLATVRGDTVVIDSLSRVALAGDPDGPHRAELLLIRALALGDNAASKLFLAMPQDATITDGLWRATEYTENVSGAQKLARQLIVRATTPELRNSLLLFLAHCAMGREEFATAAAYADSLGATMPKYGAMTYGLAAIHPAAGRLRDTLLAGARVRLDAAAKTTSKMVLYAGGEHKDGDRNEELAALRATVSRALNSDRAADQLSAAMLSAINPIARVVLTSALARTKADSLNAMLGELALDSIYSNAYAPQHPLLPRARLALDLSRKLNAAGRANDALTRLATVPEDFGFNIAYLPEVHRRRADLMATAGRPAEANLERSRATRLIQ